MTNSIPKIPVSMGYQQLKNAAMKDLMDIFKGTENMPLKDSVQVANKEAKQTLQSENGKNNVRGLIKHQHIPNKDVLIQTLKQIVEGFQINDSGSLFLKTNDIPKELIDQYNSSIEFKGEFFNFLRNILQQHGDNKPIESAVADVLRAYISLNSKTKHENRIAENLDQLVKFLSSSKGESSNLHINELKQLSQENQPENQLKNLLPILKGIALEHSNDSKVMAIMDKITESYGKLQTLQDQESSLHKSLKNLLNHLPDSKLSDHFKEWNHKFEQLFSLQENQGQNTQIQQPKAVIDKIMALFIKTGTIEDGADYLDTVFTKLGKALREDAKGASETPNIENKAMQEEDSETKETALVKALLNNKNGQTKLTIDQKEQIIKWLATQPNKDITSEPTDERNTIEKVLSKIMDKSQQLLDKEGLKGLTETFLKGMTATQNSKQPLLHFFLPIEFEDMQAMGEIWIDPNEQESGEGYNDDAKHTHMYLTLNVELVGNFELDILLSGQSIDIQFFCPPTFMDVFSDSSQRISEIVQRSGLHLNTFLINTTEKNRPLNDIFPDSFEKRMGVNVKA